MLVFPGGMVTCAGTLAEVELLLAAVTTAQTAAGRSSKGWVIPLNGIFCQGAQLEIDRDGLCHAVPDTASPLQFDPHFPSKPPRSRLLTTSRAQNRVGLLSTCLHYGRLRACPPPSFPTLPNESLRRSALGTACGDLSPWWQRNESLGMACPRGRKMLQKFLCTEGESDVFQRDSYRSLVSANSPRGCLGLQKYVPQAIAITRLRQDQQSACPNKHIPTPLKWTPDIYARCASPSLKGSRRDRCAYGARTCKSVRRARVTFQFVRTARS